MSAVVVTFDRVTTRFGDVVALDDVSFEVSAGEITVLLGPSGSGKSTLLRHVDGLQPAGTGVVRVLGTELAAVRGRRLRHLRRRIGFVFQQFHLVARLSVLENVCTGALGRLRGPRLGLISYPRAVRREALRQLERVGLAEKAFHRADTLSGGQQQRVAVARALMQHPDVLLADEPVASLDPESASQVMALIREIAAERGLTVLCSLHQVDLALSWADRVIGLRSGQVVLDKPAAELDQSAVLALYAGQAGSTAASVVAAATMPTYAAVR